MSQRPRDFLILGLVLAGLALAGAGFRFALRGLVGVGWGMAGLGAALALAGSIRSGVLRTNRGTVQREQQPVRFRIEAVFWSLLLTAWTFAGVLYGLGLIGRGPS